MLQNADVFNILTCKCASRHSGVQFFDIKPPKSGPYPSVFPHFDLKICFAPQPRAIFEHFWTSELPKWLRQCGVFCILTCKCASRHSRVPFFTCPLNSYLRTRRFSEPTFRTSGGTIHWKNAAIRDVPNIFRACTSFLVTLRVLIFFLLTWHLYSDISTLLDTSTLLFNSAYCRKLGF